MAYRRRQGMSRASTTFKEDIISLHDHDDNDNDNDNISYKVRIFSDSSSSSSLAAQAIKAHRESSSSNPSLSSAYSSNSIPQSFRSHKVFAAHDGSLPSLAGRNDWTPSSSSSSSSSGLWGVIARKAKSILEEEEEEEEKQEQEDPRDSPTSSRFLMPDTPPQPSSYFKTEGFKKMDNPTLRKGLYKITSSLNQIGDTFEKAFEEGRTIVESKTADIIQETRKLQVMRKGGSSPQGHNQFAAANSPWQPLGQATQPQNQMTHETQLKASRDVAMATAAKAKLLLRELKTVKADLAFAKQRCSQLEEENKILRDSREKGGNPADDDLIRLQLETLLAEKARLAHENSVYARENRFLREIVEYHQLTMQDVVYLDEGSEEVTEVYPYPKMLSTSPPSPMSQPLSSEIDLPANLLVTKEIVTVPGLVEEVQEVPSSDVHTNSKACIPEEKPTIIRPATDGEDDKVAFKLDEENASTHSKESSEIK